MQRLHNWSCYWNETNWEILCILNQYKTVPLLSNSDKCKTMGTGRNTSFKSAYAGILNQMDSKYNMNCLKNTPTGFEFYSSVNNISEMPALVILIFLTISFLSFLFCLPNPGSGGGWNLLQFSCHVFFSFLMAKIMNAREAYTHIQKTEAKQWSYDSR